jgi:hypothetical protein
VVVPVVESDSVVVPVVVESDEDPEDDEGAAVAGTPCPVAQSQFFSRALALLVVIPPA